MTDRTRWLSNGLLALGAAIALGHFALIAAQYHALPAAIPAFVDPAGRPVYSLGKSPLSACRLPLMGVAAQASCWAMAFLKMPEADDHGTNRLLWAAVALLLAAKMLLSSLDVLAFEDPALRGAFRWGVIGVSLLGVGALVPSAKRLAARYARDPLTYGRLVGRPTRAVLVAAGTLYAGLVAMPLWWR